jgi:hypothetical protein
MATIAQLEEEIESLRREAGAAAERPSGLRPAASESDLQALHSSLQMMQRELVASQGQTAELQSLLEAQRAQQDEAQSVQQELLEQLAARERALEEAQRAQQRGSADSEAAFQTPLARSGSELAALEARMQVRAGCGVG